MLLLLLLALGVLALLVRLYGPAPDDDALDELFDIPRMARLAVAAQPQYNDSDVKPSMFSTGNQQLGPREVWARGPYSRLFSEHHTEAVLQQLSGEEFRQLRSLCGRCLYHTLQYDLQVHAVGHDHVFVPTGDIDGEWLRDSAVQLAVNLPRMGSHPTIRAVVEGAIRTQAYYILQDPYANAFNRAWKPPGSYSAFDKQTAKGGWVWEHKYELDSGAYWLNLLWNLHNSRTSSSAATPLLQETAVHEAVLLILHTWQVEQHHETRSPYRFPELSRSGLGAPCDYTGLVWSAFRPSDDAQEYGYSIPGNMYAAGALQRLLALNDAVWRDARIARQAAQLLAAIQQGLARHAIKTLPDGRCVYAYEVDGRGGALVGFDDPNLPSLLAMPLLGYDGYDLQVYENTRQLILSPRNKYWYSGAQLSGLGSPHTPDRYIWPLAHVVQALTLPEGPRSARQQAALMRDLLTMQCGNGLMHESVSVDDQNACTRPIFEWANAMLVVLVEQVLGVDCELPAIEAHLRQTARREWVPWKGARGGVMPLLMYAPLEATVHHTT